jgi:hypothetical protein
MMMNSLHRNLRAALFRSAHCFLAAARALTVLTISLAAFAQPVGQSTDVEAKQKSARIKDRFVPVVTMEQISAYNTLLQGYRIQVFSDGAVIYDGMKNVKTLGRQRYDIAPERVEKILKGLATYKFWSVPADQYGLNASAEPDAVTHVFTVRIGDKERTVRFGSRTHGLLFKKLIEDEVDSSRFRCPFYDDGGSIELCAAEAKSARSAIQYLMSIEFPELMEEKK